MRVSDAMTIKVFTCGPQHTLEHAARLMWDHAVGALPVVDHNRRPIAMLTDRDICMAAYTKGKPIRDINVEVAMSRQLHVCHPLDLLSDAEHKLAARQLRRLPVVNDMGMLLGLLSTADIASARSRSARDRRAEPERDDSYGALASMRRHRSADTGWGHSKLRSP